MSEKRGYQHIEPDQLNKIFVLGDKEEYQVAILSWLIHQVQIELGDQLANAQIEILKICHHHPNNIYPGLGIHYDNPASEIDLGPLVEATMNRLLLETPSIEMIRFIGAKEHNWKALTEKIMTSW